MESNKRINVVFWAESDSEARNLATNLLSGKQSEDVWQDTFEGVSVFGYVRSPSSVVSASPAGITEILIVQVSGAESENYTSAKAYIDARRGIPFKFITSASDLSEQAKTLDSDYFNVSEISTMKEKVLKMALNLDQTLREAFQKLDTDNDGFLEVAEIISASQTLGHPLNDEDAKEIVKSLSSDGKISFEKFKHWWVMGRTDFGAFRRIVEIEMSVHNFVKQSSNAFNSYLEKLQKEGQNLSAEQIGLMGRVNITPINDFESGSAFGIHITAGNNFNDILNSFPSYLRESPVSYGLELRLKDAEQGKMVIETLTQLKEMIIPLIPNAQKYFDGGLTINFRHVGTSVFIDVTHSGIAGDKLGGFLSMFNISALNFSGSHDIHLTTQFSPVDIFDKDLRTLFYEIPNIKIEGKAEYNHLKTLITFAINTINDIGGVPRKMKPLLQAFKLIATIRKLDFSFKYDSSLISEVYVDLVNDMNKGGETPDFEKKSKEWIDEKQPQIKGMFDMMASQAGMFIEPYKPLIQAIDFDNINVYGTCPIVKAYVKGTIQFRGVSDLIGKTFA